MGESMWAQLCADIENDCSAEREISATQWHSHGIAHYNPPMGDERRLGGEDWVGILTAPQAFLVSQAESPKGNDVVGPHLDIILDDIAFFGVCNLFFSLALTSDLKGLSVYLEIADA